MCIRDRYNIGTNFMSDMNEGFVGFKVDGYEDLEPTALLVHLR